MKAEKCEKDEFDEESVALREMINAIGTGQPVEIRAPTPKGPKITQEDVDLWNGYAGKITNLDTNVDKLDKELD